MLEAIDAGDEFALADELGDVLLQVVMHAAIAGSYGAEVWIEMGILALYLLPSLALGLLFRRPVIRANNWIIEKLEETKLM